MRQANDMYAAVNILWPPPNFTVNQHANIATIMAGEFSFSKDLLMKIGNGSLIEKHQVCYHTTNTALHENENDGKEERCTPWFNSKNATSDRRMDVVLSHAGLCSLVLRVQFCTAKEQQCATTDSPPLIVFYSTRWHQGNGLTDIYYCQRSWRAD